MYEEILKQKTKLVFNKIVKIKTIGSFYLAGGTALALQFGHRESIDLDWFSKKSFSTKLLKKELSKLGNLRIDSEEEGTLNCSLDNVKLSFFEYPYRILFPLIGYEGIKIADFKDIACMKLDAISSRGSKKDFVDLYFLLKEKSLEDFLIFFNKKYKGIEYNKLHLLKSLVYFKEAEADPMPKMIKEINWEKIKENILKKVKNINK